MDRKIAIFLAAILLLQFLLLASLHSQRPFLDEGRYLTTGWLITQGKVPFVDMISSKPPGIEFALAAVFTLFGPSLLAARLFVAFIAVLQLLLIFAIGKKLFNEKAGLLAALFYCLWSLGFSSYWAVIDPFLALISSIAVLLAAMLLFEVRSPKSGCLKLSLFGVFLALGMLFKQTMVPFAILMLIALLALDYSRTGRKPSIKLLGSFAIGFFIVLAIFAAYLSLNNAFEPFLEAMLSPLQQPGSFSQVVIDARTLVAAVAFLPVPITLIALWKGFFNSRKKLFEIALLLAWFVFSFANALPFRACCMHILPALPAASILAGFLIWESLKRRGPSLKQRVFLLFSIALLFCSVFAAGFFYKQLSSPTYSFSQAEKVASYVKGNTPKDESILVFPASPEIYFLALRQPAARQFVFFDPCSEQCQNLIVEDLSKTKPKFLVYLTDSKNAAESGMQAVDDFAVDNYFLLERIQLDPPLYKTYTYAFILQKTTN